MTPLNLKNIEIAGYALKNFFDAFHPVTFIPEQIFLKLGIGTKEKGSFSIAINDWFPLSQTLSIFEELEKLMGKEMIFKIGRLISKGAVLPDNIQTIHEIMKYMDFVYHMNHRQNGKIMADLFTGEIYEGIGHYKAEQRGEREYLITCDTPYPCTFDLGTMEGLGSIFEPHSKAEHLPGPCRSKGDYYCQYRLTW